MDGLNPQIQPEVTSPDFADEADNSFEQMVALTTWVNVAVDQLNRGEPEAAVLAKLSKDGCPDPQAVLDRALKQPFEEPEPMPTPEPQVPEAPVPPQDPAPERAAQLDQQRGSSVRIGDVNGRLMGAYASFGQIMARVATDEGQVDIDVSPDEVEIIEEVKRDPLSEIQKYIDDFPTPDTERKASMLAHAENLRRAREFVASALTTTSGSVLQRLAGVDEALARASEQTEAHIASMVDPEESAYLESQPSFGMRAVVAQEGIFDSLDADELEVDAPDWDAAVHEDSEILVMEADPGLLAADEFLQYAASRVASAPDDVRERYMANISRHRDERLARLARATKAPVSANADLDDIPVESLFT